MKTTIKNKNKGFTIIELMVTVTIIGILGAVAVPAYQDYTIRGQVAEGFSLASGAKVQVAEEFSNTGVFPSKQIIEGFNGYVKDLYIEEGVVTAVFGEGSNRILVDNYLSIIPIETEEGNLKWDCESSLDKKYLPNSCSVSSLEEDSNKENEEDESNNGDGLVDGREIDALIVLGPDGHFPEGIRFNNQNIDWYSKNFNSHMGKLENALSPASALVRLANMVVIQKHLIDNGLANEADLKKLPILSNEKFGQFISNSNSFDSEGYYIFGNYQGEFTGKKVHVSELIQQ